MKLKNNCTTSCDYLYRIWSSFVYLVRFVICPLCIACDLFTMYRLLFVYYVWFGICLLCSFQAKYLLAKQHILPKYFSWIVFQLSFWQNFLGQNYFWTPVFWDQNILWNQISKYILNKKIWIEATYFSTMFFHIFFDKNIHVANFFSNIFDQHIFGRKISLGPTFLLDYNF